MQLLVECVEIGPDGFTVRLRIDGLSGVALEMASREGAGGMKDAPPNTMTVKFPIAFKRCRGRKRIMTSEGTEFTRPPGPELDNVLVKAIARAYRWQRMLENGEYATLQDLAKAERLSPSYVSRVLRLTLLSPAIVEEALAGNPTAVPHKQMIAKPFPLDWREQARLFSLPARLK